MKTKRFNTVPNGTVIVITYFCLFILFVIVSIPLFPKAEAFGILAFSLIPLIATLDHISKKHWNFIDVSENHVSHNGKQYSWETVYITIKCHEPTFARNAFEYYVYFDDHYLTEEECDSKAVKKRGFYMILTMKRAAFLFQLYEKRINVLNESPYHRSKKITEFIRQHNSHF